jgi:tetratricopeptide (TPR) repeat protein
MNRVRTGILLISVLLAHGAPRPNGETGGMPPEGNAPAIAAARAALRQAAADHGEDHPVTALMLGNLALAMREGGYFNYAERYSRQAIAILERHFGPNDVSLVPALNVLAEAEVSQGRYDEARATAARAVGIGPDAGAHYGTALHNLAAIYQAAGKLHEAADYYRRALAVREKVLPPGHPHTLLTRAALRQVQQTVKTVARR